MFSALQKATHPPRCVEPGVSWFADSTFKGCSLSHWGLVQSSGLANQKLTSGWLCGFVFRQINETVFLSYNLNRIIKYFPLQKARFCIWVLRIGRESLCYSVRSPLTNHAVIFFKLTGFSCVSLTLSPQGAREWERPCLLCY